MFTIQYTTVAGTTAMQEIDGRNRERLVRHLSSFSAPILAVYERASPITKAMRAELAKLPPSTLSRAAREFVSSRG